MDKVYSYKCGDSVIGNYGVYYEGKLYIFDTEEQMNEFTEKLENRMQKAERKSVQIY